MSVVPTADNDHRRGWQLVSVSFVAFNFSCTGRSSGLAKPLEQNALPKILRAAEAGNLDTEGSSVYRSYL
jgi:hypothetical protein